MNNEAVHHRCRNLDGGELVVKSSDYEELRKLFLDKCALIVELTEEKEKLLRLIDLDTEHIVNGVAIPTFNQALKSIVDK